MSKIITPGPTWTRRSFVNLAGGMSSGLLLVAGSAGPVNAQEESEEEEEMVGATEDMMREHGILRRVLFLYSEAVAKLRHGDSNVDPSALVRAATLFRDFGERYHEQMLEERHVFPEVRRAGGEAARLVGTLEAQHARGREITSYVLNVAGRGRIGTTEAEPLARAMDGMVRMYRPHAAREDTVVFPAWTASQTPEQLRERAEEFEDIEHAQFGEDGFDEARETIAEAEAALGLHALEDFTAPPPPKHDAHKRWIRDDKQSGQTFGNTSRRVEGCGAPRYRGFLPRTSRFGERVRSHADSLTRRGERVERFEHIGFIGLCGPGGA